ncbi:MAG: protoheme IX farnesyltransferase [Anaerolineae bacterium]|nr:protoheme IX farnesyltransferase [Anaerolineae bacterium]
MSNNSPLGSVGFRRLAIVSSSWILFLIFVGAVVRVTGSGMGCPDWPLCYNQVIPPAELPAWIEFIHRVIAGIAGGLTIAMAVLAWRNYRECTPVFISSTGAVVLVLFQGFLGGVTVWFNNAPLTVIAHVLAAVLYLAITLVVTTVAHLPAEYVATAGVPTVHKAYFRLLILAAIVVLALIITGATVVGTGTGLACLDWPLCQGEIFPAKAHLGTIIQLTHRFTVVAVGMILAAVVLQTRRRYPELRLLVRWSTILGVLFLVQVVVGGLNVLMRLPQSINALHLTIASAVWASLIILITLFYFSEKSLIPATDRQEETGNQPLDARQKAAVYFKLTKPWVMALLLTITIGAMFIAARGLPPIPLMLYTLLGGALAAGGASALNSYIDSDIDGVMSRTSRRPTVTGLVTPEETLFFGLALSTLSFVVFASFVNMLSAALSTLGILYYVFFYTLYLKRSTIHNIIIGGAAGALPPLVGWAAVTGTLDLKAIYLFALIFFWTPPHTWALALLVKKDYAQAHVPMLPVVVSEQETAYQIFLYSVLLIALTLLPFAFNMLGLPYLIAAVVLGVPFLYLAWKLWRNYGKRTSKQLYKFSQTYLALLFLVMVLDSSLL